MFKRLFSFSNPLGIALTATAVILTLSPEARKGTRKVLVKGAAALLSVGDQVKELTVGARKQIGTIVEEAKVEKEHMALPDFSEMIKNAGESTKAKMNQVFDDMNFPFEKNTSGLSHATEMGEEFIEDSIQNNIRKAPVSKNTKSKAIPKIKKSQTLSQVQNVLSDNAFNTIAGKPPLQ
ncbi:hypothetical protein C0971_12480 [Bacillus methanolicus]|uniref:hypothetical protein n=1 Tax=Bacillus methanolicus TaxID=1471 RepID=UPI00200C8B5A|nr:hypothetical protein [Bacillus methanolicus]UQD52758.1 hypothetical protein C0971_12480 [Bacillus methanolicus]